jgi:TatA/E family protein of Tat protein translocase
VPGWIGPLELLLLLVIVLLVFGPKRLPEMGRSLGRGYSARLQAEWVSLRFAREGTSGLLSEKQAGA